MMDEMTQNVVLDAVYACPDPQIQEYFHQLMLKKDNIYLGLALKRTFTKFKEVLLEQMEKSAEIQYILKEKHKFSEGKDMTKKFSEHLFDVPVNDQLFSQLERLSDATLSDAALQKEIDNSNLLCLKTQIQTQIDESRMLIKQVRSTAPWLLSLHPDVEECFSAQSACLTRLLCSIE